LAKERLKHDKGWLRKLEAKIAGHNKPKPGTQLTDPEKHFLVQIEMMRQALPTNYPNKKFPLADHAFAWGVTTNTIKQIYLRAMERNNDVKRKKRTDAGLTVFNSEKKCEQLYRPLEIYKRYQRSISPGETFTND